MAGGLTGQRNKIHDPIFKHHPREPAQAVPGLWIKWLWREHNATSGVRKFPEIRHGDAHRNHIENPVVR
jgi:hypothetical protein